MTTIHVFSVVATVYDHLLEMTNDAQQKVRFLSHNLLPEHLEIDGLALSLEKLLDKLNWNGKTKFSISVNIPKRFSKQVEFELYNICLELINNVIKHADATEAQLKLEQTKSEIRLEIKDNGIGLKANNNQGMGLQNIQDRVDSLGGTWQVESLSVGTCVSVIVPII